MLTAYAKKNEGAYAKDFQEEYPIEIHCIWEAAGNRTDQTSVFFQCRSYAFCWITMTVQKWQFCFCTIIHWILNCYQCRVEGNGIHKASDPLFWTLLVHQVPWRLITFSTWEFLSMQEKKHHTLSHMKCEPISLPASHVMDIVSCYGAIPQRKPILPHLPAILSAIPMCHASCTASWYTNCECTGMRLGRNSKEPLL